MKKGKSAKFDVKMTIDGSKLRGNYMNSGSQGANPDALTINEYDGYLLLDDGAQPIHMAWHVLPRQAADVKASKDLDFKDGVASVKLDNKGQGAAQNDAYSLIATSDNLPQGGLGLQSPTPDLRAVGITTIPVPAGVCSGTDSFVWVFALNTWERQQHLLPVSFWVELDTNQDGDPDFAVLNRDASGLSSISDGRQLTWALNLTTGASTAFFFAENATNTGNTALTICGEQIGMNAANFLQSVNMDVYADDFYYGGPGDSITGLVVAPLAEQYIGIPADVPAGGKGSMNVTDAGPFPGNTPEQGILLFTNGDRGAGLRGGATQDTEALLLMPKGKGKK